MTLVGLKDLKKQKTVLENSKIFLARVVDNNDPFKLQRVKFRISKLHRGVKDAELPWAIPIQSSTQGTNQIGTLKIPVVGATICVEYLDDYSILYRGDFITDTTSNSELTNSNYPNCYGFVDRSGNKLYVDTQNDTVSFTHLSGTTINISQNGDVTIQSPNTTTIAASNLNLQVANTLNIDCDTLNLKTNNSNISSSTFTLNSTNLALKSSGPNLIEGASITMNSSGAVTMNAASFALKAAFNLTPVGGWVTPPSPTATAPSVTITAPTAPTSPTARTKPTITGFSNQLNY